MIGCDDQAILNFDKLHTTNQIQCLKILLPYIKDDYKKIITTYIKIQELQYTLSLFHNNISLIPNCSCCDISSITDALYPYCNDSEKDMIHNFQNLQSQLDNFKDMESQISQFMELQQMMDMMNQTK